MFKQLHYITLHNSYCYHHLKYIISLLSPTKKGDLSVNLKWSIISWPDTSFPRIRLARLGGIHVLHSCTHLWVCYTHKLRLRWLRKWQKTSTYTQLVPSNLIAACNTGVAWLLGLKHITGYSVYPYSFVITLFISCSKICNFGRRTYMLLRVCMSSGCV